jgi:hypothetical protein
VGHQRILAEKLLAIWSLNGWHVAIAAEFVTVDAHPPVHTVELSVDTYNFAGLWPIAVEKQIG